MNRLTHSRRRMFRMAAVLLIVAIGIPVSLSQLGSTSDARFGASDQLGPNRLLAATLSIAPGSRTTELTVVGMTPGDEARGRLDLVNDGSLPLRYSMALTWATDTSGGELLANELEIVIWRAVSCGGAPSTPGSIVTPTQSFADAGQLFGSPSPGQDRGDRLIPVDGSETLCYVVSLPLEADNNIQAQSIKQSFIVHAEHDLPTDEIS